MCFGCLYHIVNDAKDCFACACKCEFEIILSSDKVRITRKNLVLAYRVFRPRRLRVIPNQRALVSRARSVLRLCGLNL